MSDKTREFEAWWESDGKYCRAGGGDYERTFAYEAWQAASATLAQQPAPVAQEPDAIAEAKAWCAENEGTPAEFLAHQLLTKRSRVLGRPLTWREAIELTALTTNMPDAERDALLALDDAEQPDTVKVPRLLLQEALEAAAAAEHDELCIALEGLMAGGAE